MNTQDERNFALELGYMQGAGPEIEQHLISMADEIDRLRTEATAAGAAPVQEDYRIILDGNMWFASGPGFIDLHESKGGFGSTPIDALNDLVADPKLTCDSCIYLTEPCDIGPCSTCTRTGDFGDNHTLATKEPS